MHLLRTYATTTKTNFYELFFQPALNLLYCSTILLKWSRISTGIRQWQCHGSMTCDFLHKKDNQKWLSLLHVEVDSHNPTDNSALYMMPVPLLDLWNDFWRPQPDEKKSDQPK